MVNDHCEKVGRDKLDIEQDLERRRHGDNYDNILAAKNGERRS